MDHNTVVLSGRLAATPEIREFENSSRMMRLIVVSKQAEPPHRKDTVPVTVWQDVEGYDAVARLERGARVWVAARIQRRFWAEANGRRSGIEVVAQHVSTLKEDDDEHQS